MNYGSQRGNPGNPGNPGNAGTPGPGPRGLHGDLGDAGSRIREQCDCPGDCRTAAAPAVASERSGRTCPYAMMRPDCIGLLYGLVRGKMQPIIIFGD